MPSAKIVAQNPGGNFNPLSSAEQAFLEAPSGGLDWLCARAQGPIAPIAARTNKAGTLVIKSFENGMANLQGMVAFTGSGVNGKSNLRAAFELRAFRETQNSGLAAPNSKSLPHTPVIFNHCAGNAGVKSVHLWL